MTAQRWPDDVGSVADEAGRLLESLRRAGADAASAAADRTATPAADPATPAPGDRARPGSDRSEEPPSAAGFHCEDPVCQWCPVCRASAFVRQLSPETLSGLAELAGFAATVLGDLASARARQADPDDRPDEQEPTS